MDMCTSADYTRFPGCTSVYLCVASLQNLAVPQDFCSLSVFLKQSFWPRIWWCGTSGFQEPGQCFIIGLSCSIPTIVFYYFSFYFLSVYRLVLYGWGLRTGRVNITLSQPCAADFLLIIIIITNEYEHLVHAFRTSNYSMSFLVPCCCL